MSMTSPLSVGSEPFTIRPCPHRIFASIKAGMDPEFHVGGGAKPPGGRQHMILPKFAKNCMKLRKFWAVGGGGARAPLNPPLERI